ncbi:MAG: amidohydrolase [Gemmatimonadota bacterium]|nr:amidohydrolase [Gemmatimonadota bacterium]
MIGFHRIVTTLITLLLPGLLSAQEERIKSLVEKHAAATIMLREHIHQNPELGNREFKTADLVARHLLNLGMEVRTGIAHTGVVGILNSGKQGPVVAVRADMDALPVTEDTPFSFKSTVRTTYSGEEVGVMHACGHDIHTSVQLGVASVLAEMKDDIPGTILFIFQPSEEGAPAGEEGGARLMLKEGVFDAPKPEAVFGLHALPSLEVGTVGYTIGPAFAAVDGFRITVHGQQAHGARPNEGIDPIVMASEIVLAFQTIRSRTLSPLQPSVITVGIFKGGIRSNIIPSEVVLQGTVRTYDPATRDAVERRMDEILKGITIAYGGDYDLVYTRGISSVINDKALTVQMAPIMQQAVGVENAMEIAPTMGGEDFAAFSNTVPGLFYRLGVLKPGTTSGGLHTPTMTADNGAVPVGMRVMSMILMSYLQLAQ